MKYANWKIPDLGPEIPGALVSDGCTPLLAAVLRLRGITEPKEAKEFFNGGEELLSDPQSLPDMAKAVHRLEKAIDCGEHVAVYGDYDVDGITSTCLLSDYLRSRGLICESHIPDRLTDGYGLNNAAIDELKKVGVTLIITVDCGITNLDEARHAAAIGMDMIITDHHECRTDAETGREELPDAEAVVNPKRSCNACKDTKNLAGVGVAFKLVCALDGNVKAMLERYADLVAVGTVADVMSLQGENRFITRLGLQKISSGSCRPGFLALAEAAGTHTEAFTASNISFALAPRINAAGRLGKPEKALQLLEEHDRTKAKLLAEELGEMNKERKKIEDNIMMQADVLVNSIYGGCPDVPIVLAQRGWHQGVIGIVASRLSDKYSVPAIMVSLDKDEGHGLARDTGKGSCRSAGNFNLFDALSSCADCLEGFGGHAMAAGITVRADNVETLRHRLGDYYKRCSSEDTVSLTADILIDSPDLLTMECVKSLDLLEPCGNGNPRPKFCMKYAKLLSVMSIGSGKHLRLTIEQFGQKYDAVFFNQTESALGVRKGFPCDIVFDPQINTFHNRSSVQLVITDLRRAEAAQN